MCTLDNGSVDPFECHPDDSGDGGGAIEPCLAYNSCDDGLLCYPGEYVPGCDGSLCCTPFCDVTRPDACAELGMVCELWYLPDQAPRGLENLGVCAKL